MPDANERGEGIEQDTLERAMRNLLLTRAVKVGAALFLGSAAAGQDVRHTLHTDASGTWVEISAADRSVAPFEFDASSRDGTIVWHLHDPDSITNSVAVSDTTDEAWVGHNLNSERLSFLQTSGDGTPIYEYDLVSNPDIVAAASAEAVSLGVVLEQFSSGTSVHGFTAANGASPVWTYAFAASYNSSNNRNLDVAADGSIVIAAARDSGAGITLVVILDGVSGVELRRLEVSAGVMGAELSDDGSRAVLTEMADGRVIDTADMSTLFSFSVSGAGGYHRLSRDGRTVAAGGFNLRAFHEDDDGVWQTVWSTSESSHWFGNGIALSGNGDTMFAVSHNYATGYIDLTYRMIDLTTGSELGRIMTNGSGSLQDAVRVAQASADGQIFAVASWGTQDNVHPEVQVFDRELNRIAGLDTPGSPFDIDLTADGRYLVAGTKHVHANDFGRGSDTYSFRIGSDCRADFNGDGVVNTLDFLAFLNAYNDDDPAADFNGDGIINTLDFLAFLNAFNEGCP